MGRKAVWGCYFSEYSRLRKIKGGSIKENNNTENVRGGRRQRLGVSE